MSKIHKDTLPVMLAIIILSLTQFIGCGEDAKIIETETPEIPVLPPDESITVNLLAFNDGKTMLPDIPSSGAGAPRGNTAGKNFANAAARVLIINDAIASAIAFPAGLFKMAKETKPVMQNDGSWLWSYTAKYDVFVANVKLNGMEKGDKIYWSMKVSVDNPIMPITDFEWYTGVSTKTNTSGSWQLYDLFAPNEHNPTAKIDWSTQPAAKNTTLAIENVNPSSEYLGTILLYTVEGDTLSMSFRNTPENETWEIVWNAITGAGSIVVPKYNYGKKACWDMQKQDVECD